uniref:EGF-like domain-containing protein n=1 Tax=Heterorhabditis bacteriophora TaxID=37862 RepID=A0A1I7XRE9_HETBA
MFSEAILTRRINGSFKEHLKKSIHKGKVENLPQIPKLDKILDVKSLTIVNKETAFDPCKTAKDRCLNNGRCESRDGITEEKSVVLDPDKLREKKKQGNILTEEEMTSLMITIEYECICNEGFVGPLCEISEMAQYCEEQHCNGRGTGFFDTNGTCSCQCDSSKWYGDRCEFQSPCANFECFNSGKCETKVDLIEGTIEAFCKCPNGTEIIDTFISGEHCEIVEAKYSENEKSRYIPCTNNNSHDQWLRDMSNEMSTADHEELYSIYEDCKEISGQSCRFTNTLSSRGKWCYGNATCEPRVATIVVLLLLEKRVRYMILVLATHVANLQNVFRFDSLDMKCVYMGTGNCSGKNPCNHGQCMNCEHTTTDGMIQICDKKEKKTDLDVFANLVSSHHTVNRQLMRVLITYVQMEELVSPSPNFNMRDEKCKFGSCYNDISAKRQFSCDCSFGYYGRDCDRQLNMLAACTKWLMENSNITMPIISVLCTIVFLFLTYCWCSQDEKEMISEEETEIESTDKNGIIKEDRINKKRNMSSLRIQDAIQGNKKIFRSKKHNDRLDQLMKRLFIPRTHQATTTQPTVVTSVLEKSTVANKGSDSRVELA